MAKVVIPIQGTATRHYPINRIITRGMGVSRGAPGRAGLVTQGYGGSPPQFVIESFRTINLGQSGAKRRLDQLDEVVIWAKLIELNNRAAPPPDIKGWVTVKVDKKRGFASVIAEHISSRTRAVWETIKVTARRLK